MSLNKKNRLRKKLDFENVFRKGKAVKGSFLFIKYRKNGLDTPRFGFVVSAKVAKKAVERNKIRRILSEAAGDVIVGLGGYDIVVFVNSNIIDRRREDIVKDFLEVLKRYNG